MTGKELDEIFGEQKPPSDTSRIYLVISTLNYKLMEVAQLMERLLPAGDKRKLAFKKLCELKAANDSSALDISVSD